MIAARQRTTRIDEPPVLFRLPDLRKRSAAGEFSRVNVASKDDSGNSLRVDSAENVNNRAPSVPAQTAGMVGSSAQALDAEPALAAKSWMERIGSRLILLVTLVVIVSAAWVTGRRMPASKPGTETVSSLTRVEPTAVVPSAVPDAIPSNEAAMLTPPTTASEKVVSVTEPIQNIPSGHPIGELATSDLPLTEPANRATSIDSEAVMAEALKNETTAPIASLKPGLVTSNLPSLQPNRDESSSRDASQSSVFNTVSTPSSQVPSLQASLAPANRMDLLSATGSQGQHGIETAPVQSSADSVAQTASIKTGTPNELTLDPSVLVPWVLDRSKAQQPVPSVTPNPIVDWSRYLPLDNNNSTSPVRAASATEPSGGVPAAQQALYPANVNTNFYNR